MFTPAIGGTSEARTIFMFLNREIKKIEYVSFIFLSNQ